MSKAVKDLVGGNSKLQKEILGDFQAEFSSAPEKGEELPPDELGASLFLWPLWEPWQAHGGCDFAPRRWQDAGGFNLSAMKAYLGKQWILKAMHADATILLGVTLEPAKPLGSEPEAKA